MLEIITSFIFCMLIPFVAMGLLVRSLKVSAPKVKNYRGKAVFNGLGIVWFIWLISYWVGGHILGALHFELPLWIIYFAQLFPLIAGACAFGLLDDWVGDHKAKGFRGHLRALTKGVLTTGGLKMLSIGVLSFITAISMYGLGISFIPRVVLATCTIALMANFINLFDLRPGRAGKMYVLGLVLAILSMAFGGVLHLNGFVLAAVALAGLGPLLAVWRFDLGERGMLGDAGANSMGAFLGFLLATSLPLWGLALLVVALFALNIASEYVSFSSLIERTTVLRVIDNWGRKDIEK